MTEKQLMLLGFSLAAAFGVGHFFGRRFQHKYALERLARMQPVIHSAIGRTLEKLNANEFESMKELYDYVAEQLDFAKIIME